MVYSDGVHLIIVQCGSRVRGHMEKKRAHGIALTLETILGGPSAIFWGLMMLVSLNYVTLMLFLSRAIVTAAGGKPRRTTTLKYRQGRSPNPRLRHTSNAAL